MKEKFVSFTFILFIIFALLASLMIGRAVNGKIIQKEEKKLPIYYVHTEDKVVALSFNCAWNIDDLDSILSTLEKNDIRSTFFMTGEWVEKYPEAVKKIQKAGHDLASHGDRHRHMNALTKEACKNEIYEVHKKVYELTGVEMELFRPPYGEYNDMVIETIRESGYYPIQWQVDSLDWKNYGVERMVKQVVDNQNLTNGAIILLHNGTEYTASALQQMIDGLKNKGYGFLPVSQLILRDSYEIDVNGQQKQIQ